MDKFKVGDKVVLTKNEDYAKAGMIGTIIEEKRSSDRLGIKFDKKFYGGHDCFGQCGDGYGHYVSGEYVKLVSANSSIHIYTDGITTTAILKDGKKAIRTGQAKCSPDDTYDFNVGAKLAFDRLMENEVKEVKRKAKVGEWVKIVSTKGTEECYKCGDVFKVEEYAYNGIYIKTRNQSKNCSSNGKYNRSYLWHDEYVVLENYKPEKPIEDKPEIVPHLIHIDPEGTYGNIGDDTEQTDLLNNKLKVGDTVLLYCNNYGLGERVISKNEYNKNGGVMGTMSLNFINGKASGFSIIKHRGYEEITNGEIIDGIKYIKADS